MSLFFSLGGFLWAVLALRGLGGGPFVLHFNDMLGITMIGGWDTILFMGILGIFVVVFNTAIAFEFESRSRFLARFLVALTLVLSVLLFIGFASIIGVN
ncbi:MAG: hypothetical protein KGJ13_02710 [Patescibacteria group bacterium]|nr:hypothetical protein [Patescibacteria group bacterium]